MSNPHDLSALASNAQKEIATAQAKQDLMRLKTQHKRSWSRGAGSLLVAGLVVFSVSNDHVRRYWLGVSEQEQAIEMTAVLNAANLAVDRSHATTGEWPDRVPLPALASLVDLQNPGPNYRLLARTQHVLLTMTPTGELLRTQP